MRDQTGSFLRTRPRALSAVLLAVVALLLAGGSVLAAFVSDDGNLFSASARSTAETRISQIQRDTGKTIAVKTVPNLGGKDVSAAADQYFSQQNLNGVLIFAARDEKKLALKVGVNTRPAVTTAEETAIRDQLTSQFAAGKFDDGLLGAIDRIGNDLRAASPARTGSNQPATAPVASTQRSGVSPFVVILAIIVIIALIALVFAVFRRNSSTSSGSGGGYGPNYGPQGGGYGPGYGPGYGQQGGGGGNVAGSILGAAGGIGGAIIGNAIYDHFRDDERRDRGGDYGGNSGGNAEPGYADDRGRADDSPVDSGSWGDSGGGDPGAGDWGGSDSGSGSDSGGSSDLEQQLDSNEQ